MDRLNNRHGGASRVAVGDLVALVLQHREPPAPPLSIAPVLTSGPWLLHASRDAMKVCFPGKRR